MSEKMKPKRIQRSRTKGWRMPEGCMYVGRPTIWGNPFQPFTTVQVRLFDLNCITMNEITYEAAQHRVPIHCGGVDHCLAMYRVYMLAKAHHLRIDGLDAGGIDLWDDIRGKDLACWCDLNRPCHADVLLELANP